MHIYVHFPYCLYKCDYCDFNSYATPQNEIPSKNYVETLIQELELRSQLYASEKNFSLLPGSRIESIFFGGGTPSLMQPEEISQLLNALSKKFWFASDIEITLEANPGTIDKNKLQEFKSAGISRVSLGVQSLSDKNLARFGRIHTGVEALTAVDAALEIFGHHASCDLIFGFPEQEVADWKNDLQTILARNLNHLSCYSLTAEQGTIYTRDLKKGKWPTPDDDVMTEMFLLTRQMTSAAGLNAYEISNFARPGFQSRHNLGYWKYHEFLGLGAGASGQYFITTQNGLKAVSRTLNKKIPEAYQLGVVTNDFFSAEEISKRTAQAEFMMMGLRLEDGILFSDFKNLFSESCEELCKEIFSRLEKNKLITMSKKGVAVTDTGRLKLNQVVQEFL